MKRPILACMLLALVTGCMVDRDGDGRRDFGWWRSGDARYDNRMVDNRLPTTDAPAYPDSYWYDSIHRGSGGFWQTRGADSSRDLR